MSLLKYNTNTFFNAIYSFQLAGDTFKRSLFEFRLSYSKMLTYYDDFIIIQIYDMGNLRRLSDTRNRTHFKVHDRLHFLPTTFGNVTTFSVFYLV